MKNIKNLDRLDRIANSCAAKFLSALRREPILGSPCFRKSQPLKFQGATPTVNELCELARKHNFLLLFKIENERESLHLRMDPNIKTVSQISKALIDFSGWLEPMVRDGDDDADDSNEDEEDDVDDTNDENPIPGHEDDTDEDGGAGADADDDDDDDDWDDEDDDDDDNNQNDDGAGDEDDDDEDDDDEDEDDDDDDDDEEDDLRDERENRYLDEDDNAWTLRRLIATIDDADLRLTISPVRKSKTNKFEAEKITIVTTFPARTVREVLNHYRWWTRKQA